MWLVKAALLKRWKPSDYMHAHCVSLFHATGNLHNRMLREEKQGYKRPNWLLVVPMFSIVVTVLPYSWAFFLLNNAQPST